MEEFYDKNGALIRLSFVKNTFSMESNHVLVLCKYKQKWLLTKHRHRGREFPGGKRELGETLIEAAHREVFEETGATIKALNFVGEYEVSNGESRFVKTIFYAEIAELIDQPNYFETEGPLLISDEELQHNRFDDCYSFIMQDDVLRLVMERLQK